MKFKTHHLAASLFAGALFLATAAWFGVQTPTALATCQSGTSVMLGYPAGSTSTSLTGVQTLHASQSSPTSPIGMTFMITAPTTMVLGQGILKSGEWVLDWDSRNVPNATYQMQAVARYPTGTAYDCPSPITPFSVNNTPTQAPTLSASINPNTWQGLPGQSANFNINAIYTDQFGRQSPLPSGSTITWNTNAGTLSSSNTPATILTAGPNVGPFVLGAAITANGVTAHPQASIKIVTTTSGTTTSPSPTPLATKSPSPSPSPAPASSAPSPLPSGSTITTFDPDLTKPLSAADTTRLATDPTIFRPADPTNTKPVVPVRTLGCLERKIGEDRFAEISTGKAEPSTEERRKGATCFTGSDKIPAVMAPVQPSRITELATETTLVKVNGLKNQTTTNDKGDKINSILVSGIGAPNSSVFIYIFSDPMVLRAETDKQGKWSYVLQNPLAPGKHEVYAVAEKDSSTFVRSSAVPISIAAAAPGSTTGSLIIENTWQPAQIAFVAIAVLMVAAGIFLLLRLRRKRPAAAATPAVATAVPAPVIMPAASAPAPTPAPAQPAPTPPSTTEPPANETKV